MKLNPALLKFVLCSIFLPTPLFASPDSVRPPAYVLSITGVGLSSKNTGSPIRDYGIVDPTLTGQLIEDAVITNSGQADVKIVQMTPSCSCMTATVTSAGGITTATYHSNTPAGSQPVVSIEPGSSATLHVTINTADASAGMFIKTVTIATEPLLNPPLTVSFQFEVLPKVTLIPVIANFGSVLAGSPAKIAVSATMNKSLLASFAKDAVTLHCSNAFVKVSLPDLKTSADGSITETYDLTLDPATPIGQISGTLSFASSPSSTDASPWKGAQALLMGQVTGAASAWPQQVSFGSVYPGSKTSQTVTITGPDSILGKLTVHASDLWFSVDLLSVHKSASAALMSDKPRNESGLINVTLGTDLKPGSLFGSIYVTLANRQTMVIPVSAVAKQ
jgi:hypothetical protein